MRDTADGPGASRLVPCVGGVVTDGAGRLLMIRRAHPPAAGAWSLPGGRVEPGEDDATAVVREIAEETGLAVEVGEHVGTVRRDAPDGRVYDIRDYRCRAVDPRAVPRAGDDATDAQWVDADAYGAMDATGTLAPGLDAALTAWDCRPRHPRLPD